MRSQSIFRCVAAASLAGGSLSAAAHVVTTGFGPVADGIGHFAVSPEDLIPAIALAVFAGLRGKDHARRVSLMLPLAWVAGGAAGLAFGAPPTVSLAWLPLLAMGGLVALDLRVPLAGTTTLALLLGAFVGYANGAALAVAGAGWPGIVGIAIGVAIVVTLVAAGVALRRSDADRLADDRQLDRRERPVAARLVVLVKDNAPTSRAPARRQATPNQRARRLAPKCSFSERSASVGSW